MFNLRLNRSRFARNRIREQVFGDVFNKTYKGIIIIMPLIFSIFFTPTLIVTSLLSKEIIFIFGNSLLSLGYLSNFAYRLYQGEVSKAELLISILVIAGLLTLAYFLCPPLAGLTFISALTVINQMAIAINLFFLIKHVLVPPCKKLIEYCLLKMGLDIAGNYYSKPPFILDKDRHVLDKLLKSAYGYDSFSEQFTEKDIISFNQLLSKLTQYINKYDESLFGYINNSKAIANLEYEIHKLTTEGNPDGSYTFVKKKIDFKNTKIKLLNEAIKQVKQELVMNEPHHQPGKSLEFFKGLNKQELKANPWEVLAQGLECLYLEIDKQHDKIASLQACLPKPNYAEAPMH